MKYTKQPLSIAQQIDRLKNRGLAFEDEERAKRYLSFISFYRLRAYTYIFQDNSNPDHPFIRKTSFNHILNIYLFDRKLRLLVFDAIERIEIAFRTQLIYHLSLKHGGYWFEDSTLFRNKNHHKADLKKIDSELSRSYEPFIKHYKNKYSDPERPPAWMTLETASLGMLSKFYENLRLSPEKKAIAKSFYISHPFVMENWMHGLSVIRNIAAHHGRLWNRDVSVSNFTIPNNTPKPWLKNISINTGKMYLALTNILYLLNTIIPNNHFKTKLKKLINNYPEVSLFLMGFPKNWETEEIWK